MDKKSLIEIQTAGFCLWIISNAIELIISSNYQTFPFDLLSLIGLGIVLYGFIIAGIK